MTVAIIDYGLGNLFSVKQACIHAGMKPIITSDHQEIGAADGLILPGVGAFEKAMDALQELELLDVIKSAPDSGQPLIGICLGAQLLLDESHEFGRHDGLGLVSGNVRRLNDLIDVGDEKVPHVGWNRVLKSCHTDLVLRGVDLFEGVNDGDYMYFVHSYGIETVDRKVASVTRYGKGNFSSAIVANNVVGFQFHPERSGPKGLRIYQNLSKVLQKGE